MTQPLASGVTACHQLKTDQDQDPALSPFLESLPLSTGDTLHVAEWSQIKEGILGTGMRVVGGYCPGLVTRLRNGVTPRVGWLCGQSPFAERAGTEKRQVLGGKRGHPVSPQ